jgi:hypothetical protein
VDLLVGLLQAFGVLLASTLAPLIVRRLWRQQRAVRAAHRHVTEVDDELDTLIRIGHAEFSNLPRTKHALAVERLRDQFPHLSEPEAHDLILTAEDRRVPR